MSRGPLTPVILPSMVVRRKDSPDQTSVELVYFALQVRTHLRLNGKPSCTTASYVPLKGACNGTTRYLSSSLITKGATFTMNGVQ